MPQHVTFAPGETISADGQAGIFFLDPKTGAAEGWVVPAFGDPALTYKLPFSFTLGGLSADGSKFVYRCDEPHTGSGPVLCGGSPHEVWYLFDTESGKRTRLDAFTRALMTLSPDGKTLLGETADGLAFADAAHPGDLRRLTLPTDANALSFSVNWSPDGSRLVLVDASLNTFLVRVSDGLVTELGIRAHGASWSSDGAKFAMGKQIDTAHSELMVLDRDGGVLWSKPMTTGGVGGVWSADGSLLYASETEPPLPPNTIGADRVDILDSETGATTYRVRGGLCPIGWVGPTHHLITESYGFGQALVDASTGQLTMLNNVNAYGLPTPFDPNIEVMFDGSDFRSYDLSTGATKLIAHTTVTPAWDTLHGALFAGSRIVFTALHLGHGGCGEGSGPENPPKPELLVGPFADDAPVTMGPGQ